jgi:hypothetical protein
MTIVTPPAEPFASRRHHPLVTALMVVVFWMIAAGLVMASRTLIEPWSARGNAVAEVGALLLTAYTYSRLAARDAGVSHALGVGTAWLMLSIATEVVLTTQEHRGWFTLLGSPEQAVFRNVMLFVWIFAPALFVRRGTGS